VPADQLLSVSQKWKKITEKTGGTYSSALIKYRILLLKAIESINKGLDSGAENKNVMDLSDDTSDITHRNLLKSYDKPNIHSLETISNEITAHTNYITVDNPTNSWKRRITIWYEMHKYVKQNEEKDDNPFVPDDISLSTDCFC